MYYSKAAYRPPTCTIILCPVLLYMWVLWKVEKVGNLKKIFRYEESECDFVVWGPWVFYMCNVSQVFHEKAEREGGFSAKFLGMIIFSMELYYGDQLCSKCMTKSFVSYPVNELQADKYNILMTLQSAITSASWTKIAGNCTKWKIQSKTFPCLATVGGLFCQLNQSCWKLHEMDRSSLIIFPCLAAGGGLHQVLDEMFNDVWNMLWQSYTMWHNASQVSHHKAEGTGGIFGRSEPTWGLGDWSP